MRTDERYLKGEAPLFFLVYLCRQVEGEDVQLWGRVYWVDDTVTTVEHNWHIHMNLVRVCVCVLVCVCLPACVCVHVHVCDWVTHWMYVGESSLRATQNAICETV